MNQERIGGTASQTAWKQRVSAIPRPDRDGSDRVVGESVGGGPQVEEIAFQGREGRLDDFLGIPAGKVSQLADRAGLVEQDDLVAPDPENLARNGLGRRGAQGDGKLGDL